MVMKAELKNEWVAALRSGKFKQAKSYLEKLDADGNYVGNCCLGVLCRTAKIEAEVVENVSIGYCGTSKFMNFMKCGGTFTPDMLDLFGFGHRTMGSLISMNDSGDYSFDMIADWIEENIEAA